MNPSGKSEPEEPRKKAVEERNAPGINLLPVSASRQLPLFDFFLRIFTGLQSCRRSQEARPHTVQTYLGRRPSQLSWRTCSMVSFRLILHSFFITGLPFP